MSVTLQGLVWLRAPYKGSAFDVLLALADSSDDNGYSYPSKAYLAAKTRQSERAVQYAMQQLRTDGILESAVVDGKNPSHQLNVTLMESWELLPALKKYKDKQRGAKSAPEQGLLRGGAKSARGGSKNRHCNKEEPSVEPSVEPIPPIGGEGGFKLTSPENGNGNSDPSKELKARIRKFIQTTIEEKTEMASIWDASESTMLDKMVRQNKSWTVDDWEFMLRNWRDSDSGLVRFGDRPRMLLSNITRFAEGPVKRLGKAVGAA